MCQYLNLIFIRNLIFRSICLVIFLHLLILTQQNIGFRYPSLLPSVKTKLSTDYKNVRPKAIAIPPATKAHIEQHWRTHDKTVLLKFLKAAKQTQISSLHRQLLSETLRRFTDFCDQHKLSYMLYGGTLLGSYQHHGFVPWDDDADIFMNVSDRPRIKNLFANSSLVSEHQMGLFAVPPMYKVYFNTSETSPAGDFPFKWPYIDICFFVDTGLYLANTGSADKFRKSDIYPLIKRPFDGMMLWAPRCTLHFLKWTTFSCCTNSYNHRLQRANVLPLTCIDCRLLGHLMGFVTRRKVRGNLFNETVFHKHRIRSTMLQFDCNS